ncbi:uncharacterized protein LOC124257764 isoform X1 [Haliotis rubra]|uniref:uncharacterized protein LOC124257764 isoform X1 n=1 Tax=Haliotis rubra TaxID=36100 RepID=UPI001EE5C1FA|nr:uncharacterized protein LOC124257764 isoform X1 [Haliotis rubra]
MTAIRHRLKMRLKSYIYIFLSLSVVSGGKQDFAVNVNNDGTYNVVVQGDVWLKSAPTFFRADGQVFSSADGSLKLVKNTQSSGVDVIGQWEANSFLYQAGSSQIEASFVQYTPDPSIFTYNNPALPFILFKQRYINGANNTASNSSDLTIAGFPGFLLQEPTIPLGYLGYAGLMFGSQGLKAGQLGPSSFQIDDGLESGPLAIFDRLKTANTLIISPASRFMSSSIWRQNASTGGDNVYWGTMGGVENVPLGVETSFILFCGNKGINKAFVSWGQILQRWHGRTDQFVKSDFSINYLGYWTDNGAYYYNLKEKGKNYQDTVLDIKTYIGQIGVPVRYIQYDAWWYHYDNDHGIITWSAQPSVFPNGMQWLYNKTQYPVVAHSMFWSANTTYATTNGGKYKFLMDGHKAVPLEERFWTDLLANARKWGLFVYEQDYLDDEFTQIQTFLTDIDLGRQWLTQMGNGAAKNGLTIQYCMSYPRHMLQSLEIPVVTQSRASFDYHPGSTNWRIGVSSLFAWAIGVTPFKDNFWTTTVQPGNAYNSTEPYTSLNAVIATLSTGPVGISDMIGHMNKTLIMKSVNADGLILKPSRPATAIDNQLRRMAWTDFDGPDGELWSTYSDFGGKNKYGIVLAADLRASYNMTPCMAGYQGFPSSMVFPANNPNKLQPLTDPQPLALSTNCTKADFCLFYVSPVLTINGKQVLIQGELDKWVPMSPQRVTDINIADDITISLTGAAHETVSFWFNVDGKSSSVTCTLGAGGLATLSFTAGSCRGV